MNQLQTIPKKYFNMSLIGEGEMKITDTQADKIMEALTQPNPPKFIKIGEELFATHQISKITVNKNYV